MILLTAAAISSFFHTAIWEDKYADILFLVAEREFLKQDISKAKLPQKCKEDFNYVKIGTKGSQSPYPVDVRLGAMIDASYITRVDGGANLAAESASNFCKIAAAFKVEHLKHEKWLKNEKVNGREVLDEN